MECFNAAMVTEVRLQVYRFYNLTYYEVFFVDLTFAMPRDAYEMHEAAKV
ncbi:hypothetical protein [Pontibacter sp. HSC-36F09]|nr:hypothetical protein [Pontibacter sp. HSC-36F09]MCP2044215.1 hypothetical protein [Pontibacter sp. HSC-36F09]